MGNVEKFKVLALFSGGKDSTLSVWEILKMGYRVVSLLTVKPLNPESWMFHYPCINLTPLQSEAMQIPLYTVTTKGEKEKEIEDLKNALKKLKSKLGFEAVVSGVVESEYQKSRIEKVCEEVGLVSLTPLWHKKPEKLLEEIIANGFNVVFTAVAAEGLTEKWLNRKLDWEAVEELKMLNKKFKIHLTFEGGEAETFVKDTPFFKKRIEFLDVEKIWRKDSGYLLVRKAVLLSKG